MEMHLIVLNGKSFRDHAVQWSWTLYFTAYLGSGVSGSREMIVVVKQVVPWL